MKNLILILALSGLMACNTQPTVVQDESMPKEPEVLTVHPDGAMELNNRFYNKKDVVIYPDGYGGERAAVKVRVPLHPDFYRDTIRVERIEPDSTVSQN